MKSLKTIRLYAVAAAGTLASAAMAQSVEVSWSGDTAIVSVASPPRYLIFPVEEEQDEARVVLDTGSPADTWMDVRLARTSVDYEVPFPLGDCDEATVKILGLNPGDIALKNLRTADAWTVANTERYRPIYHHTPSYGWMNDANGMVFKDGEYHLYFQFNPYGSKWGNMHWGHAVSTDLVHWQELAPAIGRDTLGHIFSGSSVIDVDNTAGYGKDAIVAVYTSASDKIGQVQSMAYSTDNGRTFTKYENNPVLTPFDGLRDFRDPKVFWNEEAKAWFMIVSADKEMRFYKSADLKNWEFVSGFGNGYGAQPSQYECPDFVQLPVNGDKSSMKYVMLMNVNPGCVFGGSATEYFVGDFDGTTFTCLDDPYTAKWLDFGKDHYATVCFYGTGDRVIGMPWMSNWQYANSTPTMQYRGANGLPRELTLYTKDGKYYVAADVAPEVRALRGAASQVDDMAVDGPKNLDGIAKGASGAFEVELDITPGGSPIAGLELRNSMGEKVTISFDMENGRVVMDRTESGLTGFAGVSQPLEGNKALNYRNDFALATWAPLNLCDGGTYHLDIFVDRCSVELFIDQGRIAMTNLVFPTEDYDSIALYSDGGTAQFKNINVYKLRM